MQGALLRSGKNDEFIALGDTGQPVYRAALQIIAALGRRAPQLAYFLAVPKSNEQGDRLDWYSSLAGDVIPWSAATEDEREAARSQLMQFRADIRVASESLVQAGTRSGQTDQVIFGKLLGLCSHVPSENDLYLVETRQPGGDGQPQNRLQPVLAFWGFVAHDADRQRDPLFFLDARPEREMSLDLPSTASPVAAPAVPAAPALTTTAPVVRPWWRRFWWLWLLLLLPLLLWLLSMLRGCVPQLAVPGLSLPAVEMPAPDVRLPQLDGELPVVPLDAARAPLSGAGVSTPITAELPAIDPELPTAASEPSAEQGVESPVAAEPPALPETPAEPREPLRIPPEASEGPADFLNGKYSAGAGIMDARTARPLRLKYDFENGQGQVTLQHSNGVTCSGPVSAAMQDGTLGISSDAPANCSDGSSYQMPQVACAPGAQSIADCQGRYGNQSFPMSMRRE